MQWGNGSGCNNRLGWRITAAKRTSIASLCSGYLAWMLQNRIVAAPHSPPPAVLFSCDILQRQGAPSPQINDKSRKGINTRISSRRVDRRAAWKGNSGRSVRVEKPKGHSFQQMPMKMHGYSGKDAQWRYAGPLQYGLQPNIIKNHLQLLLPSPNHIARFLDNGIRESLVSTGLQGKLPMMLWKTAC